MLNLFILLLERVGLIILLAYILMNINHFKTMMSERQMAFKIPTNHYFWYILYDFKFYRN